MAAICLGLNLLNNSQHSRQDDMANDKHDRRTDPPTIGQSVVWSVGRSMVGQTDLKIGESNGKSHLMSQISGRANCFFILVCGENGRRYGES